MYFCMEINLLIESFDNGLERTILLILHSMGHWNTLIESYKYLFPIIMYNGVRRVSWRPDKTGSMAVCSTASSC